MFTNKEHKLNREQEGDTMPFLKYLETVFNELSKKLTETYLDPDEKAMLLIDEYVQENKLDDKVTRDKETLTD